MGFKADIGGVPEPRSRVFVGTQEVGLITSVVPSLELRQIIALGTIRGAHESPGTKVRIESRGDEMDGEVAALPFATPGLPQPQGPPQPQNPPPS